MQDLELCRVLLGLDEPWQVDAIQVDRPSNRIDVVVGWGGAGKKGLFKASKAGRCPDCRRALPATDGVQRVALRHLPFGASRTYLHVPAPGSVECDSKQCTLAQSWAAAGAKLTHELEARVMEALEVCGSVQKAAQALGLGPAEVRAVAERTGAGLARDSVFEPDVQMQTRVIDIVDRGLVPVETDPVWDELIGGRLPLVDDRVALKLLLERVRQTMAADPDRKLAAARVLRNYFIRNQARHRQDLAILQGSTAPASAGTPLPGAEDPVWRQIIDGTKSLKTQHVALGMMIERVRLSVLRDPATRNAGARMLRQFFAKHAGKLKPELQQLLGGPAAQAAMGLVLPAESDRCWQRLIDGEIALASDSVGLKMMLERIRISIVRKPTPANRKAGARILRQYFIKHRRRHRQDIKQLAAQSGSDATLAA
jgi:hypothetical protein